MRRSAIATKILLALTLGASVAACEDVETRVARHYERGLELREAGEEEKAAVEFRNALRLDERHAGARFEIAKVFEADGNLRAALGNYREAADLDTENAAARIRLARLLLLGGQLDEAVSYAAEALELSPDDPDALLIEATVLLGRGEEAAGLEILRRTLEIAPHHVDATVLSASYMMSKGEAADALEALDDALVVHPEARELNVLKLRALAEIGDDSAAMAHLRHMSELYPENTDIRRQLARNLAASGEMAAAEEQFRAIADAEAESMEAAADVVRFVLATRGEEAARSEMDSRIASAATPELKARLHIMRAELDYRSGDPEGAKQRLSAALDATEDDAVAAPLQVALAQFAVAEERRDEAAGLLAAVLEDDPANIDALALRARLRIDAYEFPAAISDLRTALDSEPDNVRLLQLSALAHQRNGSPDLAGENLASAAQASGFEPEVALNYASFLLERGRDRAAETVLSETARRHPQDASVLAALARLRIALEDWVGAETVTAALRALEGGGDAADQLDAAALTAQGRFDESIRLLENMSASVTARSTVLASLVTAYMRSGRIEDAEAVLDDRLAAEPDDIATRLLRAEVHLALDQPEEGQAMLGSIVERSPESPVGYTALARLHLRSGRVDEAESVARAGIEAVEADEGLRSMLAAIYDQRGDFDGAIEQYDMLYRTRPNSLVYANNLASLLAEHYGDDETKLARAASIAQRLRVSDVPHFQDTYGWIMFLRGEHDRALRSLIPAAEALPNMALVRYHLGRAYAAVGEVALARENLEAALTVSQAFPKAESAREALASLPADETETR